MPYMEHPERGGMLYEMLTGQLPFEAEDAMELVLCHLAKILTPPFDLTPRPPSLQGKGEEDSPLLPSPFPLREGGRGVRFLSDIIMK